MRAPLKREPQLLFGALLVRDVLSLKEDPGYRSVGSRDGLVHEIDVAALDRAALLPPNGHRHAPSDQRLPARINLSELIERIFAQFRPCLPGRPADEVASADEFHEGGVDHLEDEVGSPHDGDEARSLLQQAPHLPCLKRRPGLPALRLLYRLPPESMVRPADMGGCQVIHRTLFHFVRARSDEEAACHKEISNSLGLTQRKLKFNHQDCGAVNGPRSAHIPSHRAAMTSNTMACRCASVSISGA